MGFSISRTRATLGIQTQLILVEVHISAGLPSFVIVGLPETAVKESKDRVRSAIQNSPFEFPLGRITVNLSPANLPKTGSGFDLAIAIGILAASYQIPPPPANVEFVAELALNGELRPIPGIIPITLSVKETQSILFIPAQNEKEASLVDNDAVFIAHRLIDVCQHLTQEIILKKIKHTTLTTTPNYDMDWSDIKGQSCAKQALFIAAAGGHSLLLSGPPGSGKTMLAKRLITILPLLHEKQALECAAIHSLRYSEQSYDRWRIPPFRSPHHTASSVALVGGGSPPKPGEISLAHHGVLFLDELPEFQRHALETLREPLESGSICISRIARPIEFPAQFQLIAAMNPCPCGYAGSPLPCRCSNEKIARYLNKISGPLLDRIDLHIGVQALSNDELLQTHPSKENSQLLREHITSLRTLQLQRQQCLNAHLNPKTCEKVCQIDPHGYAFLKKALSRLQLSARAYHRLLKVARTIADIQGAAHVSEACLKEAFLYKQSLKTPGSPP